MKYQEPERVWKVLLLECDHVVQVEFELKQQYPTDEHYVLCPNCLPLKDIYGRPPTAWQKVVDDDMRDVRDGVAPIVSGNDVLRLQSSISHTARYHPFPYRVKRRGFRIR